MTRLAWDVSGQRFFETGVDRGVLYAPSQPGVAWSGLISVVEDPSGGDARPFYLDGVKYVNIASAEEFEATISAFSAPAEFGPCDGNTEIQNGLIATQQPRRSFGLSYRTLLGNDIEGQDHAYKLHLVYNALAAPSRRNNSTIGSSTNPAEYSWQITVLPPSLVDLKPTSHLVVDTRYADPGVVSDLEDLLYGTEAEAPALPDPADVIALFV